MEVSFLNFPGIDDSFAFVSFERHRTYSEIATTLYSDEYRAKINACNAIVVRPPVDIPIQNLNEVEEYCNSETKPF